MEDHTAMVPAPFTAPSLLPLGRATARAPLLNLLRTKTTMGTRPLIMGCRRGCSYSDAFGSSVSSGVSQHRLCLVRLRGHKRAKSGIMEKTKTYGADERTMGAALPFSYGVFQSYYAGLEVFRGQGGIAAVGTSTLVSLLPLPLPFPLFLLPSP